MNGSVDISSFNQYKHIIYVSRLAEQVDKDIIQELFSHVGPIRNVLHDPAGGIAFVEYVSQCSVLAAMLELANVRLFNKRIKLSTLSGSNNLTHIFSEYLTLLRKLNVEPSDIGCRSNLDRYDISGHELGFCDPSEIWDNRDHNRYSGRNYGQYPPMEGNYYGPVPMGRNNYGPAFGQEYYNNFQPNFPYEYYAGQVSQYPMGNQYYHNNGRPFEHQNRNYNNFDYHNRGDRHEFKTRNQTNYHGGYNPYEYRDRHPNNYHNNSNNSSRQNTYR